MGFIFDRGATPKKTGQPATSTTPAATPLAQALPGTVSQRAAARYGGGIGALTATPALVAPAQSELVSLLGGGG